MILLYWHFVSFQPHFTWNTSCQLIKLIKLIKLIQLIQLIQFDSNVITSICDAFNISRGIFPVSLLPLTMRENLQRVQATDYGGYGS